MHICIMYFRITQKLILIHRISCRYLCLLIIVSSHHYLRLCHLIIVPFCLYFDLCCVNSSMVSFCLSFVLHKPSLPQSFIIIRIPSYSMSSYVSCHILNYAMSCHHYFMTSSLRHHHVLFHHICHATSSTIPCHAITTLVFH